MPVKRKPILIRGPERSAIRAFRAETREDMLRRQFLFLGAQFDGQEQRLARALRAERRLMGGKGYDPARHFALLRWQRGRPRALV